MHTYKCKAGIQFDINSQTSVKFKSKQNPFITTADIL